MSLLLLIFWFWGLLPGSPLLRLEVASFKSSLGNKTPGMAQGCTCRNTKEERLLENVQSNIWSEQIVSPSTMINFIPVCDAAAEKTASSCLSLLTPPVCLVAFELQVTGTLLMVYTKESPCQLSELWTLGTQQPYGCLFTLAFDFIVLSVSSLWRHSHC